MSAAHGRYRYSALPSRPPGCWPNGKRLALYVALGIEEYAFGNGLAENILPVAAGSPSLVNTAWRDYGNRVGGFRLIERLARFGIAPAILLNTDVYETAPDIVAAARAAGCEIVAHGAGNSDTLATLSPDAEAAYVEAVAARIARAEGARPRGWSSPWLAHSPTTLDTLAARGFGHLLDLRLDDQPVRLATATGELVAIPYAAEINDSTTMIGRQAGARDFADMIVDEFDELLDAAAERPLVMSIVVHSFISGQPFRLRALTRALEHIAARAEHIWFASPAEIAAAARSLLLTPQ